jgi:ketosteroid isomerase-like protein
VIDVKLPNKLGSATAKGKAMATVTTLVLALMLMTRMAAAVSRGARAQSATSADRSAAATVIELTRLLHEFLDNAGKGERAGFEKFFADDVVYTRSNGLVTNKAEILRGVERLKPTEESKTRYSAEDIVIHDYGHTAVVAFRLVAETQHQDAHLEKTNYRNTGVFLRRNGVWQVVAWQSTKAATSRTETSR